MSGLSIEKKITYTCDLVKDITGLTAFFDWLISVLKFDFLVLNEDRHFNNIGVLYNSQLDKFSLMPVFDNGAALLSDLQKYPLNSSLKDNVKKVQGKPFSTNFQKQFDICCGLSDAVFKINYGKVEDIFEQSFLLYSKSEVSRCVTLLQNRLRLYEQVFK